MPEDRLAWSRADGAAAEQLWETLNDSAKALFSELMTEPGRKFSGDELSRLLDLPKGKSSVAGVLGTAGKRCYQLGRALVWCWGYPGGKTAHYWMTEEVAALFKRTSAR
ncbi:DUF6416 domain-containing protein [Lentzea sp. NPDC042327]|uniref:DUF6416 domain-containing protein n=1 Tax=Lentzea sp. NPDC042327 TaxID=3154801 RepID=UPI0033F0359A